METLHPTPGIPVAQRVTAQVGREEIAVFLIGFRINKLWKVHKWVPVARAMGRMLKELNEAKDSGLRHIETWPGRTSILVQYWDSFDAIQSYAMDKAKEHIPAWSAFNKAVGSNGDVGIWHETYRVHAGDFECVYNNMPAFGLAAAYDMIPAEGPYARSESRLVQAKEQLPDQQERIKETAV